MADNYLERKMEEHRSGRSAAYRPRLTPSGQKEGELTIKFPSRRVFITGGASGIGQAIVKHFADAGCRVAFCDIDTTAGNATAQATGSRFYPLNVTDIHALEGAMTDLFTRWGDLDIIINNVGVSNFKPLIDTTVDDFDTVMNTNVRPIFITSRLLAIHRASLPQPNPFGGRIINLCSTRHRQSEPDTTAYSASKGAVASLTHSLMMSLAPIGITVNAISPGWIENKAYPAMTQDDHLQHPSLRVGNTADIARLCLFLARPDNNFINGENIVVDGGMTRKMIYI